MSQSNSASDAHTVAMKSSGCSYGSQEYWEERYRAAKDEVYDWYFGYRGMRSHFFKHVSMPIVKKLKTLPQVFSPPNPVKEVRTLVVGCGNSSKLSFDSVVC